MNRINFKALADGLSARGYPALASVVQDTFGSSSQEIQVEPTSSPEVEADAEVVDVESLRESVMREYESRIDSLEMVMCDALPKEASTLDGTEGTSSRFREESDNCQDCGEALDRLISAGKSRISMSCLNHMLRILHHLSLNETLEDLLGGIRHAITGSQLVNVYINAQVPALSKVLYETLLEKTFLYATFIPEFCSSLPFDLLRRLLDDDALNISSEDDILDLIEKCKRREVDELRQLASCVRFPFLTCTAYDKLAETHPEALLSPEYELCGSSKDWLSDLSARQLTRRRHYSTHLHVLWHEDSVVVDEWEKMAVSCVKDGIGKDILSSEITEELESVVEARGRCAVSGRKIVVGASSGTGLWAWLIDTSSCQSLGSPEERIFSPTIIEAEFGDAFDNGNGRTFISWLDDSDERYHLGLLDLIDDDDLSCDEVDVPSIRGNCRSRFYENILVILSRSQLILFDREAQASSVFDSPASTASNFLDLVLISSADGKNRVYVYDFRVDDASASPDRSFKELLLVFDLDRLRWEEDSWDLGLDSGSTHLRLQSGTYNGISLVEYRGHVAILAETTENGVLRFKITLVQDGCDDEWTETIADILAVTDGGLGVREALGLIPIDLAPCVHETVFNRYCRQNPTVSQLTELRKLAE